MSRVLVADLDLDEIEMIAVALRRAGFDVLTAVESRQVLQIVSSDRPDVILVDVRLPGGSDGADGDGIETCRRLKNDPLTAEIPVIVTSSRASEQDLLAALSAGARDLWTKPLSSVSVVARIQSLLEERLTSCVLRNLNRSLLEAKEEAEGRAGARGEMLANLSHEIRTPLTSILGYTNLLLDGDDVNFEERQSWIQTIRTSGEYLLALLNNVLDMSKIDAGRMTVELMDVSPRQLLEEVLSLMRPRAIEKGIELEFHCDKFVPRFIRSDAMRLRQILVNLVSNAIKFTEEGRVDVSCRVRTDSDRGSKKLEFEVKDSGIGMSPEEADALFVPFRQADETVPRRFGGSGLGLVISRRIGELLGGEITFQSERAKGSTFVFSMTPPASSEEPVGPVDVEGGDLGAASEVGFVGTVLVAEDVPANLRLIAHYLEREGLDFELVENGQSAIQRYRARVEGGETYDLILMDMQMPKLDGYNATRAIRSEGYTGPIVALTANALEGEREKCIRAGCDDFATKPIDGAVFIELLRKTLAKNRIEEDRETLAMLNEELEDAGEPIYSNLLEKSKDPELWRLVESFVRDLPEKVTEMNRRFEDGDYDRLAFLGHALKGAAGGYGYPQVGHVADRIESIGSTSRDEAEMRETIDVLALQVSRLVAKPRPVATT